MHAVVSSASYTYIYIPSLRGDANDVAGWGISVAKYAGHYLYWVDFVTGFKLINK